MKYINSIVATALLLLLLNACHKPAEETAKEEELIPAEVMKNLETAFVDSEEIGNVVRLNGKIAPDDAKTAKVYALVSGRVMNLPVQLGDYVKKGDVLAVLKSAEVAGIGNDLATAESNVEMTRKAMETTKDLFDGKLVAEQDYINAKVAYNKALAELNRAKQVAAITGGDNATYVITSPVNGLVIEKNISPNSEVRADNSINLFTVADLNTVWIMANVYETDLNKVHEGDSVTVNTLVEPDRNYTGCIDKIYNVLDPTNRTMKVRVTLPNTANELKPEMFVTVLVKGKPGSRRLSIPARALVMDNTKNYVVLRRQGKLQIQEVTLLNRIDTRAYVDGLKVGDEVVTNSQVFIYQALSSK